VILSVTDIPAEAVIDGALLSAREIKDLNRARQYLRDVAHRHGVMVYRGVEPALEDLKGRLCAFRYPGVH